MFRIIILLVSLYVCVSANSVDVKIEQIKSGRWINFTIKATNQSIDAVEGLRVYATFFVHKGDRVVLGDWLSPQSKVRLQKVDDTTYSILVDYEKAILSPNTILPNEVGTKIGVCNITNSFEKSEILKDIKAFNGKGKQITGKEDDFGLNDGYDNEIVIDSNLIKNNNSLLFSIMPNPVPVGTNPIYYLNIPESVDVEKASLKIVTKYGSKEQSIIAKERWGVVDCDDMGIKPSSIVKVILMIDNREIATETFVYTKSEK